MNHWEIQKALYNRLAADPALAGYVGNRIYDDVPQNTEFPYVVIGEETAIVWEQDCDAPGIETTITLHVWSQYYGRREVKLIMSVLYSILHNKPLIISDMDNVTCQADFQESFLDPDGITRHGVIRFRLLITADL